MAQVACVESGSWIQSNRKTCTSMSGSSDVGESDLAEQNLAFEN